ncbi:MAG: zinc ribbon domain-containing protein [Gemmatimonadota bacterium]
MHPDLVKLLDLQEKDRVLLDVDMRLQAALDAVAALDRELQQAEQAVMTARKAAAEGVARRDQLEQKIESYRMLQERQRSRLEHVRQARQATALMAELDLARTVLAKEESDWFRLSDQVTGLETRVKEAEQRAEELASAQVERRQELAARIAQLSAERETALAAREASAAALEKPLRVRYDRLHRGRGGQPVVVPLDGGACGACFTAIPLSRRSQIRTGLLLDGCEVCGVILYSSDAVD